MVRELRSCTLLSMAKKKKKKKETCLILEWPQLVSDPGGWGDEAAEAVEVGDFFLRALGSHGRAGNHRGAALGCVKARGG